VEGWVIGGMKLRNGGDIHVGGVETHFKPLSLFTRVQNCIVWLNRLCLSLSFCLKTRFWVIHQKLKLLATLC